MSSQYPNTNKANLPFIMPKETMFSTPESRVLRRSHRGRLSELKCYPLPPSALASLLAPGHLQKRITDELKMQPRTDTLRGEISTLRELEIETHPLHEFKKRLSEPSGTNPTAKENTNKCRYQIFHFDYLIPKVFLQNSPSRHSSYRRHLEDAWITQVVLCGYENTCMHLRGIWGQQLVQGEFEKHFTPEEASFFSDEERQAFRRYLFIMTHTLHLGWDDFKMTEWTRQRSARDQCDGCYRPFGAELLEHIKVDIQLPDLPTLAADEASEI